MMLDAEFFVAVAFVVFLGVLGYVGAHRMVLSSLDDRSKRISDELDEARRLKEEAQALVQEYRRKHKDAEQEAKAILASAEADAQRIAAEAKARMEEFVVRRTKMAEAKIAQAESQALSDVRAAAADAAVGAAERILTHSVKGKVADALLDSGIRDIQGKLN
ncbi:MAG TPA: ATP F0F1 synthase subunit B [Xanthobacteraceae bacterium]|nr:ATP F0F1 synthase subunit B [Xanthobacteraceae bacterium]